MDLAELYDLKYKYKKSNKWLFLNDRYRFVKTSRGLIFSKILNSYCNINPLILTDKTNYEKSHIISRSKIKFVSLRSKLSFQKLKLIFIVLKNIIKFYLTIITKKNRFEWLIKDYTLYDVHIGDLIYDFYIRYDHQYLNPKIFSLKFLRVLIDGIYKISFINLYRSIYMPKIFITTSRGYTSVGNLLLRYGVKKKIKTIFTAYNFNHFFKSYSEVFESVYKVTKDKIKHCEKNVSKDNIEKFAKQRLIGKKHGTYTNRKTLDKVYSNRPDNSFIKIIKNKKKNKKKIIVFAVHCFSDTPHGSGKLIFNDYYDQFKSTVEFVSKIKSSKFIWIIKPHPARNIYGENNMIEEYLKHLDCSNIILCPDKMNNNLLFKYTDYLVTTRSTIAVEFACYGKKTILGGDAPFYFKDIFIKPSSKKKYFNYLNNLEKYNFKLNSKQITFAKRMLYVLEHKTNVTLPESKFIPNPIKHPNIDIEKNYSKKLKKNFDGKEKLLKNSNFKKDDFYISIKKELINFYRRTS